MKEKTFKNNESFYKWYKENIHKIKNVKIYLENNKIRVNYDKI